MTRHALIVVDGLALDQWVPLRAALREQLGPVTAVEDDASFAWVPTLTGVSRQSIFAGEPPFFFGTTLGSTHKESSHWQRFWEERGARRLEIGYACQKKQEPDDVFLERVRALSSHPKMRLLGLVVRAVDQSMHGVVTGTSGLHSIVRGKTTVAHRGIAMEEVIVPFVRVERGGACGRGADERGHR